mgnify:CR=1 FL=1
MSESIFSNKDERLKQLCNTYRMLFEKLLDMSGVKFTEFMYDCLLNGLLTVNQIHLLMTDYKLKRSSIDAAQSDKGERMRLGDLASGILRYTLDGKEIPKEWFEEYDKISARINRTQKDGEEKANE